ncbi:hypothetical protein QWY90_03075 [Flavobacterium paronense]|uniref:DUF3244 domain-containing protein n=1 Tax=Flavobacterium paronense TaxID=1392775 RepID=A0ABV5GCP4_9FLAO|nr:hypothetical protein [Flavobacterium paronense]MDN3676289.1 hypothetical protein [Flavobacterium paronense]
MKKVTIILSLFVLMICTSFKMKEGKLSTTCDVANFYSAVEPKDRDTKVLTSSGDLEEVDVILVPTKLDIDTYKVKLTRKGSNLYKVEQTDLYIETKYCYEYATYEEVILKVTSSYGYTKGTLIFD